jgi:hypothetical protein
MYVPVYGQTIWLGQTSSDWTEGSNWSNGVPALNNDALIPTSPIGQYLPIVSQELSVIFSIENANTLSFLAPVVIEGGSITNFESATLIFEQSLSNFNILDNDGELILFSSFINHHNFNNSGRVEMEFGEQLINESTATFDNYGDLELNDVTIKNLGHFNSFGGAIRINGYFQNLGKVFNNGLLSNEECGVIENHDLFENQAVIRNDNLFYNFGDYIGNTIDDHKSIQNAAGITLAVQECQDAEGWTHYSNTIDNRMLISIQTNGEDIGSIVNGSLSILLQNETTLGIGGVQNLNTVSYIDSDDWYVLNRFWLIQSTRSLTGPFKIRFYFNESDFSDIQRSQQLSQGIHELIVYHLLDKDNGYETEVAPTETRLYQKGDTGSLDKWSLGRVSFGDYIEIVVDQLNGAYSAGIKSWLGGTIPFLNDFKATPNRNIPTVDLTWSTMRENRFVNFRLQRSLDGFNFTDLASVPAVGSSDNLNTYSSTDNQPSMDGTLHYRLELTMNDGTTRYSPTRLVTFSKALAKLYPNPSDNELYVQFPGIESGSIMVRIFDLKGTLRFSDFMEVENYQTVENIYSKVKLGNGIYSLQVEDGNKKESFRFLKMSQ